MIRRPAIALLALALTISACREHGEKAVVEERPPVVFISVDTLRADHLPMYGYAGVETPNLDALRRDGILFTGAWAHTPLTLPSHASVLTGLLPQNHGVRNNIGYALKEEIPTIATMLRGSGYATGAAVSAYVMRGATGLGNGFDTYDDAIASTPGVAYGALQRPGSATLRAARQWIAANGSRPFFYLFHLFEPHSPYEPPEPFRSRHPLPYDGEIAAADALVGELVADLKARGIYDRAVVVFFSDHGEGLSDHGEPEHGIFLYRETTRVPLVVKLPGNARAGETVDAPAGLVDLLPTVAALTGATPPAKVDGVSLLSAPRMERTIYAETLYPRIHLGASELRALSGSRYHLIQAPRAELYDFQSDPAESRNVIENERRVYASMRDALAAYGSKVEMPSRVDPEEARKLAALGYLGGTQAAGDGPLPDPKDRIGEVAALARANAAIREGDPQRAVAMLRAIVESNPRFSDAWNQLATTLEKSGRIDEAAAAYASAMRHSPEIATEFALPLGTLLLRMGRLDEAVEHAALAEPRYPGRAHVLKALVALARRDIATAEREATAARGEKVSFVEASVLLAGILAEQGRPQEALAMLDEAERSAKESHAGPVASLESIRASVLMRIGDTGAAVAALERGIAASPSDRGAHAQLASIYAASGRAADAASVIERFEKANPDASSRRFANELRRRLALARN